MKPEVIQKIKTAPQEPGCYVFYGSSSPKGSESSDPSVKTSGSHEPVLYIGKAANLRARLRSYLPTAGGPKNIDIKTDALDKETTRLEYLVLRSEIEALIEESRLIKELKPKYNIIWRDDKSYLYVYFTKDVFPKIFVGHEKPISKYTRGTKYKVLSTKFARVGPFTDGGALRLVMKLLRRFFPYCTCTQLHLRECLNAQIGKCLGFCCNKIRTENEELSTKYRKNIRAIKTILQGNSQKILKVLTSEEEKMALEKIFEHKPFLLTTNNSKLETKNGAKDTEGLKFEVNGLVSIVRRVECYDNSNLSGKESVGAMTVLKRQETSDQRQEWVPDKNSYRKFKIKYAPGNDDPRMMTEVLQRRLNHPEWPYPDLIIIDGGLTQYRAAKRVLATRNQRQETSKIKLISMAKPHKQVYGLKPNDKPTPINELPTELQKLIEHAIYQTHNFVIRYHRQVRSREMFR